MPDPNEEQHSYDINLDGCNVFLAAREGSPLYQYLESFRLDIKKDPANFRALGIQIQPNNFVTLHFSTDKCASDLAQCLNPGAINIFKIIRPDVTNDTVKILFKDFIGMGEFVTRPLLLDPLPATVENTTRVTEQKQFIARYANLFGSIVTNLTANDMIQLKEAGAFSGHVGPGEQGVQHYEYSDVIEILECVDGLQTELLKAMSATAMVDAKTINTKAIQSFEKFLTRIDIDPLLAAAASAEANADSASTEKIARTFSVQKLLTFSKPSAVTKKSELKTDADLTEKLNNYKLALIDLCMSFPSEALSIMYTLNLPATKLLGVLQSNSSDTPPSLRQAKIQQLFDARQDLEEKIQSMPETPDYRVSALKTIISSTATGPDTQNPRRSSIFSRLNYQQAPSQLQGLTN